MIIHVFRASETLETHGWYKHISLTSSTKFQTESQNNSFYFNGVQKNYPLIDQKNGKRSLTYRQLKWRTFHRNGSYIENSSWDIQCILSPYSMGNTKQEVPITCMGIVCARVYYMHSWNSWRKIQTGPQKMLTVEHGKNKYRRRWGRGPAVIWGVSRTMIFTMDLENEQNLSPQQKVGKDIPDHEILGKKGEK